jgi:hypothetical protein
MLNAKTGLLNSISVRWEDITRIRSESVFEIILSDGSTHYGVLNSGPAGYLQMIGEAAIPLFSVVSLTPIRSRFDSRFDGAVDLGYSYLKSNSNTQLNFDGGITFNEALSRNGLALVIGQFSSNERLNLMYRYLGGGASGRYFIRTNRAIVYTYAGGAYSTERYSPDEKRNNVEALLGANAQIFRLYSPKLDISGDFRLWPNATAGRYRIDANAKARVEVYKNLFVSISFFDNYDRKNPTTLMPRNDYGVVTSLGYSFNR